MDDSSVGTISEFGESDIDEDIQEINQVNHPNFNYKKNSQTDQVNTDSQVDFRPYITSLQHPNTTLSTPSLNFINSMMKDIMHRIALKARNTQGDNFEMTEKEMAKAVNLVLPKKIALKTNKFAKSAIKNKMQN